MQRRQLLIEVGGMNEPFPMRVTNLVKIKAVERLCVE